MGLKICFLICLVVTVCMDVAGERLYVPGDYASIQAAIDAAAPGDVVEVAPGVYEENLLFKAGIELRGAGSASTIVRTASASGELLKVTDAASGIIAGFKFEHSDVAFLDPRREHWPDAVVVANSNVEIRNCILGPSAGCGIIVYGNSNSSVVACRAENNSQAGIFVRGEDATATLLRNECINNEWGGILLTRGAKAVAEENTCYNNSQWGAKALGKGTSITLRNNTVSFNRGPGIIIERWASGVVEGNTCRENDENGIQFKLGSNGAVVGNTTENNSWNGIVVQSLAVNVDVRNNTCTGNGFNGIGIRYGAGGEVTGNTCTGNTRCGIIVSNWFTNPIVKNNECNENTMHGIVFNSGAAGKIEGNVCRKNKLNGILVKDKDTEPDVGQNSCEDNGREDIAREDGDPVSRQNQIEDEDIGYALAAEYFDELEKMADLLRQHKCRYSGGAWQLYSFYDGLSKGCGNLSPGNREAFTDLLERWKSAYPESVTPLITQAMVHSAYGWEARGGGYVDTVTNAGWKTFHKELRIARDYLLEAEAMNGNDPHLYTTMIDVFNCLDYSTEQLQAIFDKGVAIDVGYFPLYFSRAWNLTGRWGGARGEMERFAERAFELTKDEYGYTMYALIAGSMASRLGADDFVHDHFFDWTKIDKGYIELIAEFPEPNFYLNQYCLLACIYREQEKAKELFDQIGSDIDDSVWKGSSGFRKWKLWALNMAPAPHQERSKNVLDSFLGIAVFDALADKIILHGERLLQIGGAMVLAFLALATVFLFFAIRTKEEQQLSSSKPPREDESKEEDK